MFYKKHTSLIAFTLLFVISLQSYAAQPAVAGWIEKAVVFPQGIGFKAKLDTGAQTTSINALNPQYYERGGKRWSKFSITNKDNETITIEAPVVRDATIKRHYGQQQVRPVILLDICVGNVRKTEEVNLVDRSNLNYQLLIGRNFLQGELLIDSGSTYLLSPDCLD